MIREQTGLIYTNDNCIGCGKCLIDCPIIGANQLVKVNGANMFYVDGDRCINCGACVPKCPRNARQYRDDTEEFLADIAKGKGISVIVDPIFAYVGYKRFAQTVNWLKAAGIEHIYDAGLGAEISDWAVLKYLDEHPEGGRGTTLCAVVTEYISKYVPDGEELLFPVQSGSMCTAIYAKKYLKDKNRFAYIGTCVGRKTEFEDYGDKAKISYNVTADKLLAAIGLEELAKYPSETDVLQYPMGERAVYAGGTQSAFQMFTQTDKVNATFDAPAFQMRLYPAFRGSLFGKGAPVYTVDLLGCPKGCINGPGVKKAHGDRFSSWAEAEAVMGGGKEEIARTYGGGATPEARKALLYKRYEKLKPEDFARKLKDKYRQERIVPHGIMNEVFSYMLKNTEAEKHVDCHACGYYSCREMAQAIALGYNVRENCVYFEREENRRMYMTDSLTQIPNGNCFTEKISEYIESGKAANYTVIKFELNELELYTERYGHEEGTSMLKEFASAAMEFIGFNELLAHVEGPTFLALIKKENVDEFLAMLNGITLHIVEDGHRDEISIRIRAGLYPMKKEDNLSGDVLSRVNIALTMANSPDGSGVVYYDETMHDRVVKDMLLTRAFHEAIRQREYTVVYQPKVIMDGLKLGGAEALVRWKHDGEVIPTAEFIELYEKNGYVIDIDYYVLEQVCRDIRTWIDNGDTPVPVSVNFSKLHLKDLLTVKRIVSMVDGYEIPHNLIEIEFTETSFIENGDRLTAIVGELNENGFLTSMDDFGSGYSSLNLLSELDFRILKLDRTFLRNGIKEERTRNIISSIISMADTLNMTVVAEGVEKKEELEFLKDLGCTMIQGYYFDMPMSAGDFEERLKSPRYKG